MFVLEGYTPRSLTANAPEKWWVGWKRIRLPIGAIGNFSGAFAVKLREAIVSRKCPQNMAEKIAEIIHLPFILPRYTFICAFEQWQQHPPVTFHDTGRLIGIPTMAYYKFLYNWVV